MANSKGVWKKLARLLAEQADAAKCERTDLPTTGADAGGDADRNHDAVADQDVDSCDIQVDDVQADPVA